MTCNAAEPTLAERVFAHLTSDEGLLTDDQVMEIMRTLEREPADGARPTRRERDMREWGFVYGLAYAMADEGEHRARRAYDAARGGFGRWAGQIAPRPEVSPLVDDVIRAWDAADGPMAMVAFGEPWRRALAEAMQALTDAIGEPAPKVVD